MRILQLGPYPPPYGGVQANLVAIRRRLRERGAPCDVINLTRHRKAEEPGVFQPRTALAVLGLLLRLRYDVLHLHVGGDFGPRLVALALVCTLLPRTRTVLTFHSGGYAASPAGRRAAFQSLRGFVLRRLDRVIAVNQEIADLMARFGVARDRIRLIHPFSVDRNTVAARLPDAVAEFFRAHSPVMITVGLLEEEYALPVQIEALRRIRERHPGAGLVIVGSGSIEEDLRRVLHSGPCAPHVLLCGDLPHESTLRAVAESDVLLRTTLYDGDSIAVREALHLGTPVIATDNGMRPGGVDLVPISDPVALQRAVEDRLARGKDRESRGGAGTENIEAVVELYETLAGDPQEPRLLGAALGLASGTSPGVRSRR